MTITYEYEGALYVNLTNKCNCNCEFCLRHGKAEGSIYTEESLWLEREPTRQEALDDLLDAAFHLALFVGVLNAQEHLAAAGMGCTLTNHGHEQTADVQKAGGAGGKTGHQRTLFQLSGREIFLQHLLGGLGHVGE